ncbi:MAG TPA: hypothetical protein VH592_06280 [Gemmataceae bacterium]|jgi:hypothetical protein
MSEHIQLPSGGHQHPHGVPGQPTFSTHGEEHERTPGVLHESTAFDFRLILWVGVGLTAVGIITHFVVGGLLGGLEKKHTVLPSAVSELAKEDAERPLGQRVDNMPVPHLEGVERESSLLDILTDNGEKHRFFTSVDVRVQIGKNQNAGLFELREGQRVTLAYYMPGGAGGGLGVVTSITSPPVGANRKEPGVDLPDVSRTLNGKIIRIEPRSIAAARDWAEEQMQQYGWIDREKQIVHIPVEKAMEEVLRTKELGSSNNKKKPAGGKR